MKDTEFQRSLYRSLNEILNQDMYNISMPFAPGSMVIRLRIDLKPDQTIEDCLSFIHSRIIFPIIILKSFQEADHQYAALLSVHITRLI